MKKLLLIILILAVGIVGAITTNLVSFNCDIVNAAEFCIDLPESRQTYGSSKDTDNLGAAITPVFPGDFNNHIEDEIIEEEDINILESVIGISYDPNSTSHDYMIRRGSTSSNAYASSTFLQLVSYFTSTTPEHITSLPSSDYLTWFNASNTYPTFGYGSSTYALLTQITGFLEEATASSTYARLDEATSTMDGWGATRAGDSLSWDGNFDVDDDFLLNSGDTGAWLTLTEPLG